MIISDFSPSRSQGTPPDDDVTTSSSGHSEVLEDQTTGTSSSPSEQLEDAQADETPTSSASPVPPATPVKQER
ncbi:MAG: hypothetical protein WA885_10540 [Phormidesmis sp.]